MSKKQQSRESVARKVDLRNVMVGEETDIALDEYVLKQKKNKRKIRKGDAAVELLEKQLKAEGLL